MKWGKISNYLLFIVLASFGQYVIASPIPDRVAIFNDDIPAVTIAQGTVIGSVATDGDYFEFNGIPYADSTSGINRFKAPLPPPAFQDDFIAHRKDIKCVRALGVGYEGTEDCLVANVYTPTLNGTSRLSVMVWIKGREFDRVNNHELSFRNFVEQDVVVVSLNYRESILGFLCLGTETAPGNAGLKDIIAGLEWVKENIEQFGGNPDDITLFGHGSGAAAVDLVTLSPMAVGLVNKAIAQSGTAMSPWAVSRDNLEYAIQVAEALGHQVTDIQGLSQIFTRTSVAALMGVINELDLTGNELAFAPCVEKEDLEGVQPFLVKTPSEIIANGDFLQIPFITGFVENEGTLRVEEALDNDWLQRMDDSFYDFLQPDLKFQSNEERIAMAERIRQYYFENSPIDLSSLDEYIKYHGETMILVSCIREVRARASASSAPTYLYQFSYRGSLGETFTGPLAIERAAHSEELAYLFYSNSEEASDTDQNVGRILVERWTNFAKTGNPSSISPAIWQPYSQNRYYIRVLAADEITGGDVLERSLSDPHPETISFWDEIYEEHFLDAESNWDLTERNEEDDDTGNENTDGDGVGEDIEGEGSGDDDDVGNIDEPTTEPDVVDEDNSASTAIGYTFIIVTLFTLLNQFHCSQLIS